MNKTIALPELIKDWSHAGDIEEKLQEDDRNEDMEWKFDCNFKLDYDGDVLRILSRFYPPHYHKERGGWEGRVGVHLANKEDAIYERQFNAKTLEELRDQVEPYVQEQISKISSLILQSLSI